MRQFTPSTEVDFVVIGSGAAGGIMAKQLSVAGFSVVVLEQGGWGKYGHEQDYTKDEWLNDNPSGRSLFPIRQTAEHLPPTDKEVATTARTATGWGRCVTVTYGAAVGAPPD